MPWRQSVPCGTYPRIREAVKTAAKTIRSRLIWAFERQITRRRFPDSDPLLLQAAVALRRLLVKRPHDNPLLADLG